MGNRPQIPDALQKLLLLGIALVVFLLFIGKRDIVTSHEARVAQTARQMAAVGWPWNAQSIEVPIVKLVEIDGKKQLRPATGEGMMQVNPWLVPVINGQIRLQKPPLPYWCAAVLFKLFGLGEGWARLTPALLGTLATLLIFDLGREILGRRAAFITAGVWVTTYFVVDEYRKAMADPYLAFFTLLCVWAWMRAGSTRRPSLVLIFYVSMALGVLSKGPVIFATAGLAMAALHLVRHVRVGPKWAHFAGGALFVLIAAPWFLYALNHIPHAIDLWRYESVGELTGENDEKARAWWMYLGNSFELPLPWTPLWIGGIVLAFLHGRRGLAGPRGRRRLIAIAWYALIILFFSISPVKKKAYLLPAMPAQTLIVTDALLVLLAFARRTRFRQMPGILATAQAMLGIGFAAGIAVMLTRAHTNRAAGVICGVIATGMAILALIPIVRRSSSRWLPAQISAYALALIVLLGYLQPDTENQRSGREFAAALAAYLPKSNVPLMIRSLPEEIAFYLPLGASEPDGLPYGLLVVDHSPKDPPENLVTLSAHAGDTQVIEARRIDLPGGDGNGRWMLFEVALQRQEQAALR